MSLAILAIMVVFGVTTVVALVHVTGGSANLRLKSVDAVASHIAASSDMSEVDWCVINDVESAAIATDNNGTLCLVLVTGKHVAVHLVSPGDVADCRVMTQNPGKVIMFRLAGLAWPRITFPVRNADDADRVAHELKARMMHHRKLEAGR